METDLLREDGWNPYSFLSKVVHGDADVLASSYYMTEESDHIQWLAWTTGPSVIVLSAAMTLCMHYYGYTVPDLSGDVTAALIRLASLGESDAQGEQSAED